MKLNFSYVLSETKPGECPDVESDSCDQQCYSDADCGGDEKCCYNGCGQLCVRPRGSEISVPTQPPEEQKRKPNKFLIR